MVSVDVKHHVYVPNEIFLFRLEPDEFGFICAGVSNAGGHKRNTRCSLELSDRNILPFEQQRKTFRLLTNYASGWRKDVINQCWVFGSVAEAHSEEDNRQIPGSV